ncbi:MAG: leucyl aminopeptidase [Myxococcales bacterium]|nr:leucyl aminopeptidase [Myxococcales bacterium]|tara:strand:- start:145 stop:1608 length:1464 start_codon:yes stop_codon:yes gene_type:complete
MKVSQSGLDSLNFEGDLLVLGRFEDQDPSAQELAIDAALSGALSAASERLYFKGKPRQSVALDTLGGIKAGKVLLLGLGREDELTPAIIRDYAALGIDEALKGRHPNLGIFSPTPSPDHALQVVVGAQLGAYRFHDLQAAPQDAPRPAIESVDVLGSDSSQENLDAGIQIGDSVNLARTLTNEPANICTPERFEALAQEIAKAPGFELLVLDRAEIKARGMGGIVGVSQGASREPRFIHLTYTPSGEASAEIALVGKGLTFDSGGLNIKPASGMEMMYIDMAGAAAVLGTMNLVAKLQPNCKVHGIVGACENMTGADAYRPSDVLTMYSGKTVEILNTDAEGRLVLADCIHHAVQLKPDCIIDLATLTGACMVALGPNYAGLFSDNDALAAKLLEAADSAGESLWRLPLDPKLAEDLKSKRADITNLGGRYGGAITAAQFLQHFKGDATWAHMDIAGPVLASKDDGHIRTGGTGYAVLTLWAFINAQ